MRLRVLLFPIVAVLALLSVRAHAQEALPVVALRAEATVGGGEVLLGQVAAIEAPAELAARLAVVSLSSSPMPGTSRCIAAGYVCLRMRRYGIDPATVELRGETVTVRRPAPPATMLAGPEVVARPCSDTAGATPGTIAPPLLVRRGQIVEAQITCGSVVIRATATATRDGALGELLPVRLDRTNRQIIGRIIGPGRVALALEEDGS